MNIRNKLLEMSSDKHRLFMAKLVPNIDTGTILGIKNPDLKKLAKDLMTSQPEEAKHFLEDLPHKYFEENMLHSFILSNIKDFDTCLNELEIFKDHIDNWAVCDSFRSKAFKKNPDRLYPHIENWIRSDHPYTQRLAIGLLLSYYLGDNFKKDHLDLVAANSDPDYYVKMMVAWYFSMALAKQYDTAIGYIEDKKLETWTHNKAIQKALESRQVPDDRKDYLISLKVK